MSSRKPTHRLVLASEKGANGKREYVELASLWMGGEYDSAKLSAEYNDRPGIEKIRLTNGRVLDVSQWKVYCNRTEDRAERKPQSAQSAGDFDASRDDDVPF